MRDDYTDISMVQDKSGSMSSLRTETIGGFNSFIDDQKKVPGKCLITLMQFDTGFFLVHYGKDVQSVEPLTEETYRPGGNTALLDAIAKTITETGERLAKLPESERPGKVIVVIMTDGQENSSREFGGPLGHGKVMAMIKRQTESYKWQFVFLGANQDAIQVGQGLGIGAANSVSYAVTGQGVNSVMRAASSNIRKYRASGKSVDMNFSDKQRAEQYQQGADDKLKPKDTDTTSKKK